ncbi:MAG: nitroreductase family protein [Propionibacteriaceae bacterium]|nr:nitroreductase family protein [Propionibacteriaceae bacterium]
MVTSKTLDVIAQRYSCRVYSDKPLPNDVVDAITTAGLHAPSAVNRQPWRLIVVRNKTVLDELNQTGMTLLKDADPAGYERMQGRGGTLTYDAPVVVMIVGQDGVSQYTDLDCGIVASHLVLAAASLGVDSCIAAMPGLALAGDGGADLRLRIGLPDGFHFALSVLLGYAAGDPKPGHEIDQAKVSLVA